MPKFHQYANPNGHHNTENGEMDPAQQNVGMELLTAQKTMIT